MSDGWDAEEPRYEVRVSEGGGYAIGGPIPIPHGDETVELPFSAVEPSAEPLPDAETLLYTDDQGFWLEVAYRDSDDGQRHAQRMVAIPRGISLTIVEAQTQIAAVEELVTHSLKQSRTLRRHALE